MAEEQLQDAAEFPLTQAAEAPAAAAEPARQPNDGAPLAQAVEPARDRTVPIFVPSAPYGASASLSGPDGAAAMGVAMSVTARNPGPAPVGEFSDRESPGQEAPVTGAKADLLTADTDGRAVDNHLAIWALGAAGGGLAGAILGPVGAVVGAVAGGILADQWADEPDGARPDRNE